MGNTSLHDSSCTRTEPPRGPRNLDNSSAAQRAHVEVVELVVDEELFPLPHRANLLDRQQATASI